MWRPRELAAQNKEEGSFGSMALGNGDLKRDKVSDAPRTLVVQLQTRAANSDSMTNLAPRSCAMRCSAEIGNTSHGRDNKSREEHL
jgi:hypothetical protein